MADIQRQHGVAYLFIAHDLGVRRHISDRVLIMKDGAIIEEGESESVLSRPSHLYTRTA